MYWTKMSFDHAIEHEVKILDIDVMPLMRRTTALRNVTWSDPFLITDQYRDDDGDLARQSKRLKLRTVSNRDYVELIVKQRLSTDPVKSSTEITKLFQAPALVRSRLEMSGYQSIRHKQKIRRVGQIGDVMLMIDEYAGLPPLLEIEGPDSATIEQWIDLLAVRDHTRITRGYKGLMKHYQKVGIQ